MISKKIVLFIIISLFLPAYCVLALPSSKITIKAIDEIGKPLQGASVSMAFTVPREDLVGTADLFVKGETDNNGFFTASNKSIGTMGFSIDIAGYYQSSVGYKFTSRSKILNRWEPWNPTIEVVLKKKRNPVAMYMKPAKWIAIPLFDKPLGFDLEKGDWVTPYGKGSVKDFIFVFNLNKRSFSDFETGFTLSFSNEKDGIQEFYYNKNDQSYYKWPFDAPKEGYLKQLRKEESDTPDGGMKSTFKKDVNYIFRVRTKTDQYGNIIEAKYGKIVKEFGLDRDGVTRFRYMFNPDGTRNLEEDPARNLFKK